MLIKEHSCLAANQYKTTRNDDVFRELSKKSAQLKRILSRIPDEIIDRKTFLETIKYVII
jgi:programmed cell death protein 10